MLSVKRRRCVRFFQRRGRASWRGSRVRSSRRASEKCVEKFHAVERIRDEKIDFDFAMNLALAATAYTQSSAQTATASLDARAKVALAVIRGTVNVVPRRQPVCACSATAGEWHTSTPRRSTTSSSRRVRRRARPPVSKWNFGSALAKAA